MSTTSPEASVNRAWWGWLGGLLLLGLLVLMVGSLERDGGSEAVSGGFAALAAVWLAVAVPLTVLLRSYALKASILGGRVETGSYLKGMITLWVVVGIGAVIGLVGALVSGEPLPALLPAALAAMLLVLFPPSRRAVTDGRV